MLCTRILAQYYIIVSCFIYSFYGCSSSSFFIPSCSLFFCKLLHGGYVLRAAHLGEAAGRSAVRWAGVPVGGRWAGAHRVGRARGVGCASTGQWWPWCVAWRGDGCLSRRVRAGAGCLSRRVRAAVWGELLLWKRLRAMAVRAADREGMAAGGGVLGDGRGAIARWCAARLRGRAWCWRGGVVRAWAVGALRVRCGFARAGNACSRDAAGANGAEAAGEGRGHVLGVSLHCVAGAEERGCALGKLLLAGGRGCATAAGCCARCRCRILFICSSLFIASVALSFCHQCSLFFYCYLFINAYI